MNQVLFANERVPYRALRWVLPAMALGWLLLLPARVQAQGVVVGEFTGKPAKAAKKAKASISSALGEQNVQVASYAEYKRAAKKAKLKGKKATSPKGIRTICAKMGCSGVLTGSVAKKGGKYAITVRLFAASGRLVFSKTIKSKTPALESGKASELAKAIAEKLSGGGGGDAVADAGEAAPAGAARFDETAPAGGTGAGAAGGGSSASDYNYSDYTKEGGGAAGGAAGSQGAVPPWMQGGVAAGGGGANPPPKVAQAGKGEETPGEDDDGEESSARKSSKRRKSKPGSIADMLIAAGINLSSRVGLDPEHKSGMYPALRVDGKAFLSTFVDSPWLGGIGVGGKINYSLGLKYSPATGTEKWSASQYQYHGEALYRLAFNSVLLAPALALHLGYGMTAAEISFTVDTTSDPTKSPKNAGYAYPYGGIELAITVFPDIIRMYALFDYMFTVACSGNYASGYTGSGMALEVGADVTLFDHFHIGLGYELTNFGMTKLNESISDKYQGFFIQAGWVIF